jgi:hypothetical protein
MCALVRRRDKLSFRNLSATTPPDTRPTSTLAHRHVTIRFAPAPPEAAGELTIRIEEFVNPFPGPARQQVVGPWVFVVPLGPAPASLPPSDPSAPA